MDLSQIGIVEWFRHGEYERVEQCLFFLSELRVTHLRMQLSWADIDAYGPAWYDWLFPKLRNFELLPCALYTPIDMAVFPTVLSAPRRPDDYAEFVGFCCHRWGRHFEIVQLWNEANGGWWRDDPTYEIHDATMKAAAHVARSAGKQVALGGMAPIDPWWLAARRQAGVLDEIDVVGLHGFAGTWNVQSHPWRGWSAHLNEIRAVLPDHVTIWADEVGHTSRRQLDAPIGYFRELCDSPLERAYWYSLMDHEGITVQETVEGWVSIDDYHMGLLTRSGQPKPLYEWWLKAAGDPSWPTSD